MDILRKIVWFCLFCSLGLVISTWKNDYAKVEKTPLAQDTTINQPQPVVESLEKIVPDVYKITFKTDVLQGIIDTRGGHLVKLEFLKYPKAIDSAAPVVLFDRSNDRYYTAQTDIALLGENNQFIKKNITYRSTHQAYALAPGQKELRIRLYAEPEKISLVKEFILTPNSYQIDVDYQVKNRSAQSWIGCIYAELNKFHAAQSSSWFNPSYSGSVISTDKKPYKKIKFDKISHTKLPQKVQTGWLAFIEPYFASAWISKLPSCSYYALQNNNIYTLGLLSDPWKLETGQLASRKVSLYVGPKIVEKLAASAKNLELIIDYGVFWWLATGLFWILKQIYSVVGNWGWAIVALTSIIQLIFSRMAAKDFRAMLMRQKLEPQLLNLKERYSNDAHRLLAAESELYRREGVKPRNGFLTGLITVPISFSFYWLLLENIALRHEPFIFWIRDLSARDPYYILPLLFGLFTFINNSLTPAQRNNAIQERIALLMPAFFIWIFLNTPAGITLYWVVTNLLSILQKLWILRGVPFDQMITYHKK